MLGVRVTLRSDGHPMGTGTAWARPEVLRPRLADLLEGGDPGPETRPADLLVLMQEASVDAFRGAEATLKAAAARARETGRLPELRGASEVPTLAEVADRMQVDVQIAHAAEPVRAPAAGDAAAGPAERFVPGYHGLLSLPADDPRAAPAAVWPATALAFNLRPDLQLGRVARDLGMALIDADTLGRPGGPALFRFGVVHAVRPGRGVPVKVLERGNVPMPRRGLDAAGLSALGDRLASHLQTHYPTAGPVRGTWRPAAGRYDPSLADLEDAAFGAYALAAHDRWQRREADDRGLPAPPAVAGRVPGWLNEVASALDGLDADTGLEPGAAALLTLARLAGGGVDPVARRFAAELADRCAGGVVRTRPGPGDAPARGVSRTTRAMAAVALGQYALAADDADRAALAAQVLEGLWAEGDDRIFSAVFALPWLGRAASEIEPGLVDRGLLPAEEAGRRRAVLVGALPALQDAQVIRRPDDAPADTLGGFLLRRPRPGGVAEPTWTTAPLLEFLSLGLTGFDPQAPADVSGRAGLLIVAGSAARFLAQLTLDESSLYYARSPQDAAGGLRPALDDADLPIGPTASALLAVDALERSLATLADAD